MQKKWKRETEVSPRSVIFALNMNYSQLTSEQRYCISVLLQKGEKQKDIAETLNVSPSTISREIRRNSGSLGVYNPTTAQINANYKKRRAHGNRAISDDLREEVEMMLILEQWSPEQISGYLAKSGRRISHETIYRIIRKDKARGGDLYTNCRHRLKHRKRPVGNAGPRIQNRVSISERPPEANGKTFGDFEMDTIVGKGNQGAVVTLIERSTNMLFMRKLPKGKNAEALADAVVHLLTPFIGKIRSITTDNGLEFARHEVISQKLGVPIFFADPYSSWQKGGIENANGLIRQYIKKSDAFDHVSHQKVTKIQMKINNRPRKKLNFRSPYECFYEAISLNCTC